jgi:glycosyltransferase involved in cell wall biosynthesis
MALLESDPANTARIRVGHLIHTIAYGGVETALLNWLKTMDKNRFEVHLFCFANPGESEKPFVDHAIDHGFDVVRIPWHRGKPIWNSGKLLAAEIRKRGIQIIHAHNTYANLVTLVAGKLTTAKTITTVYVWGKFGWKRAVLQWIDQITLKRFDKVTAHCEQTFHETVARGIPASELELTVCGFSERAVALDPRERVRRRAEVGAGTDHFVMANIARFWPEKAQDVLLSAMAQVVKTRPDARLWLVGVGPEQERMQELCRELGLQPYVSFLGFRRDLPELLALVDLQVHPSDMEGVPLAICSGMAAGLPIIATSVGGLVEVLKDGQSAVLVPPRQPERLAEAILSLMASPDTRFRLGRSAFKFIEQEYSLTAATRRVESIYTRMLSGESSPAFA